jgi:hypothetical protein
LIHKERIVGKKIYNPISQHPSPGGLSQYIPAKCGDLAGTSLSIHLDDFGQMTLSFLDRYTLTWAFDKTCARTESYDCVKNDDTTYLIAFSLSDRTPSTMIMIFWDRVTTLVTALITTLGAIQEKPKLTHTNVYFGAQKVGGRPLETRRHSFSNELIGKRILWQYTPNDRVMHIYKSEDCFRLWYVEPKLADTATEEERIGFKRFDERKKAYPIYEEPVRYVRINDDLYLYYTIESNMNKALPKQGGSLLAVTLNTKRERYVGCLYGGDADDKPVRAIIGAIGCFIDEPDEVERFPAPFYSQEET